MLKLLQCTRLFFINEAKTFHFSPENNKIEKCNFSLIFSSFLLYKLDVDVVHQLGLKWNPRKPKPKLVGKPWTNICGPPTSLPSPHCSWMLERLISSGWWPTMDPMHWIIGNYCYKDCGRIQQNQGSIVSSAATLFPSLDGS